MDKSKNPTGTSPVLGDASNSIADKQLREAIYEIVQSMLVEYTNWTKGYDVPWNQTKQKGLDQLLALFHTYGNRERVEELVTLTPTLVMETECEECVKNEDTINNRIEELNREVES